MTKRDDTKQRVVFKLPKEAAMQLGKDGLTASAAAAMGKPESIRLLREVSRSFHQVAELMELRRAGVLVQDEKEIVECIKNAGGHAALMERIRNMCSSRDLSMYQVLTVAKIPAKTITGINNGIVDISAYVDRIAYALSRLHLPYEEEAIRIKAQIERAIERDMREAKKRPEKWFPIEERKAKDVLIHLRLKKDLTRKQLSVISGVPISSIYVAEAEGGYPKNATVEKIAIGLARVQPREVEDKDIVWSWH
jgi:transcriptional regulator with XRE-family HTH domain